MPDEGELADLLRADVRVVEHPNLVNPPGSTRGARGMRAALEAGGRLFALQAYTVIGRLAVGGTVVASPLGGGARRRFRSIEQHDCYEQPLVPD